MIYELLGFILIFGSILFLAYAVTRYISQKTSASMKSRHMQIIDQISLGLDKRLFLVRVGSEYFLFLSGKKEFSQVAKIELDMEEEEKIMNNEPSFNFRQVFSKYVSSYNNKKQTKNKGQETEQKNDKSEILRNNIKKLEELRVKSGSKEV